jgi:hypothetical protein
LAGSARELPGEYLLNISVGHLEDASPPEPGKIRVQVFGGDAVPTAHEVLDRLFINEGVVGVSSRYSER